MSEHPTMNPSPTPTDAALQDSAAQVTPVWENALLTLENATIVFGGLTAVFRVNMHVDKGELVGLIGPNGAGKTTIFNLVTGVYKLTEGTIELKDFERDRTINLVGKKPYAVTRLGLARTFQNIRLFKEMTVLDNVRIALNGDVRTSLLAALTHLGGYHREEQRLVIDAQELLDVFDLGDKAGELAKNLPYGEQRRLEIARAMATRPKLLLLDEPAAGMNPIETDALADTIARIRRDFDLSVLLIEHDMSLVMKICERIYVLDHGALIAEGTPAEIQSNERVIEAYLGDDDDI
ncbi:MAG: ABC transporter ATP-binding protein [Actinomycetia bacterium]|nr:ABC transporter ATP-binding protein [Actinomycetes bacterium]